MTLRKSSVCLPSEGSVPCRILLICSAPSSDQIINYLVIYRLDESFDNKKIQIYSCWFESDRRDGGTP